MKKYKIILIVLGATLLLFSGTRNYVRAASESTDNLPSQTTAESKAPRREVKSATPAPSKSTEAKADPVVKPIDTKSFLTEKPTDIKNNLSQNPADVKPVLSEKPIDVNKDVNNKDSVDKLTDVKKDAVKKPIGSGTIVYEKSKDVKSAVAKAESVDPVVQAVENTMQNWSKGVGEFKAIRASNGQRYTAARVQGTPSLPASTNNAPAPVSAPAVRSASPSGTDPKVGTSPSSAPSSGSNKTFLKNFIGERPSTLNGTTSPQIPAPSVSVDKTLLTATGSAIPAVNYSGANIPELKGNDIRCEAIVEIPKGEGYEALISACGQGLLVELGLYEKDSAGNPIIENGVAKRKHLKRGMLVKKGDFLGKQNDREQEANKKVEEEMLAVAHKEAAKKLEVEVAELATIVAQSEYFRAQDANRQMPGAIASEEVVQKAYEWKRADKSAEKAKYDLEIKQNEVKVRVAKVSAADAQVLDRKLVSPLDGFVDDIMQDEGQWLREGDPILKIVRLDKVQIHAKIDARLYLPEMVDGKEVTVFVQRPGTKLREMKGKITYARQIVESGYYFIYAEVTNIQENGYWILNPGTIVTMDIHR